jgi:hypothetical protein
LHIVITWFPISKKLRRAAIIGAKWIDMKRKSCWKENLRAHSC